MCPDGHVYNLEVAEHHNYFVSDILVHNCHHILAEQYLQILEHFGVSVPQKDGTKSPWEGPVKVIGLTATPDRGDHGDIMQVFEEVGYKYSILEAIEDGWLVPVEQELCHLEGLDLSKVRKVAGDLNARQLEDQLRPLMVKICSEVIKVSAGRPTLIYNPLKTMATATTGQLRTMVDDGQRIETIVAETTDWGSREDGTFVGSREDLFKAMGRGEVWALSSVGTLTEGVDIPCATIGVMLRLTTSRPLYAQIMGRILRPAEEIAMALNDCADAAERRALIAASSKPKATMLDFAGNAGKHKLIHVIDVLGEGEDDKLINLARGKMERGEADPFAAMSYAREELAKMIAAAKGHEVERVLVDPFALFDVPNKKDTFARPATEAQLEALLNCGAIDFKARDADARAKAKEKLRKSFDLVSAMKMLDEARKRFEKGEASMKQVRRLVKSGINPVAARAMSFAHASAAITELEQAGWRPTPVWISKYSAAQPRETTAST